MPGTRRTRKGQTEVGKNARAPLGEVWDKTSAVDKYDARLNTQSGDAGKEPGGRWTPAYYEGNAQIISKNVVRPASLKKGDAPASLSFPESKGNKDSTG